MLLKGCHRHTSMCAWGWRGLAGSCLAHLAAWTIDCFHHKVAGCMCWASRTHPGHSVMSLPAHLPDFMAGAVVHCQQIFLLNGALDRETSRCPSHDGPMTASDMVQAAAGGLLGGRQPCAGAACGIAVDTGV